MVGGPLYLTLEAVLLSARTVLPIKSSYFLSPSTTKESKSKDLKRPPKPSAPDFNPAVEPPSYCPGDEASRDKTSPSSPSSSKLGSNDPPKPQKRFPLPLHWPGPEANTCFHWERKQDQRALHGFMCLSRFPIWAKLKKNWDLFQKILLDIERNSSALHKHII